MFERHARFRKRTAGPPVRPLTKRKSMPPAAAMIGFAATVVYEVCNTA